ncbi:hypothetical protein CCHR01_15879 [Colletotrichum chrysophilum]|uniref:Uncharacterized protein n=1 Tax=Colletotrichum chrysophilum TaxID=1836956 RepID=A0AAD9E899_9PEZI|nr:hypothetical protein CCHR01_15879 [Colletotrichum chrysophilum]
MQLSVAISAILSAMAVQTALAATVCITGSPKLVYHNSRMIVRRQREERELLLGQGQRILPETKPQQ